MGAGPPGPLGPPLMATLVEPTSDFGVLSQMFYVIQFLGRIECIRCRLLQSMIP